MIDRILKQKKISWVSSNCIDSNNLTYITALFKHKGITNIKESANKTGGTNLEITYNTETYMVEVDEENMQLKLFALNKANNFKNKDHYRLIKTFQNDDCWYYLIKYVHMSSGKYNIIDSFCKNL